MTNLRLHGKKMETIFHLLGHNENAITKSLGWCISSVPSLLDGIGRALGTPELSAHNPIVKLQEHKSGAGITDLEIHSPGYAAWIIEAKRGFTVPSAPQLRQYVRRLSRLKDPDAKRGLVVLAASDRKDHWLRSQLEDSIDGIPIHTLSWRQVQGLVAEARPKTAPSARSLLRQFETFLALEVSMRNWYDNWVYVVALNRDTFGGKTTFLEVVENHRKYFHPLGGGRGGWPTEPPNYLAFRYDAHLQSIHHVEDFQIVNDLGPFFPGQPSAQWNPLILYDLGPPICPPVPMRVGAPLRAARRWCFIDTLLTSNTLAEALEATTRRESFIRNPSSG